MQEEDRRRYEALLQHLEQAKGMVNALCGAPAAGSDGNRAEQAAQALGNFRAAEQRVKQQEQTVAEVMAERREAEALVDETMRLVGVVVDQYQKWCDDKSRGTGKAYREAFAVVKAHIRQMLDDARNKPLPAEEPCFCDSEISLQSVAGGAHPTGLHGTVWLRIGDQTVEYVRKSSSPAVRNEIPPADSGEQSVKLQSGDFVLRVGNLTDAQRRDLREVVMAAWCGHPVSARVHARDGEPGVVFARAAAWLRWMKEVM